MREPGLTRAARRNALKKAGSTAAMLFLIYVLLELTRFLLAD